jgi:hypothetical protein
MPGAAQLREWADEAFKDLGGSKALFPMLSEVEQRGKILVKVKRMAERQLALLSSVDGDVAAIDPLVEGLEQMSPAARLDVFRKFLACAMPWIDANLSGDFTVRADQYKCFIGVAGADEFKRKFGPELDACIPTQTGITSAQLSIIETGVPGRAVCYCELSGVPMTVLRGLEGWRTSYRKESEKSPTHTHIDSTQFSHPIAPTTDEINRLAEDFKQFLLAVMLGVLTRSTQRIVPPGQYQFAVARGDVRRIGNERAIRQNGLPTAYREAIVVRVQDQLADAGPTHLAALAALCDYYESAVYTPKLVADNTGAEQVRKGFASAISAEAKQELRDRARRKGLSERELEQTVTKLLAKLKTWASPIGDSDADAYDWEVREPGEDGQPRLKYLINAEMLQPGGLEALLQGQPAAAVKVVVLAFPAALPSVPEMPAMLGAIPPPLDILPPQIEHQYHIGIDGQQYGPFVVQQLAQMLAAGQISLAGTKVWRQGLPGWGDMNQFAELAFALQSAMPMVPPPLMPPPLS